MVGTRPSGILRFGIFEVDLRAGELRKQGKRIKLQDQPFQVLASLLQRPGEVVSREELRSQIWLQDTFVDFDNSLNAAINKLREALGDSADSPRFVETLPRRGYRFIAPVNGSSLKEPVRDDARRWNIAAIAAIVVIVAAASGWFWHSRHRSVFTERDTIVVGDFTNSTGDSVFDGTLREGLSVQLQQSPFLSLVSDESIHQTLRMMGQPTNALLNEAITREVCQRTNSAAALNGSIALIGTRYNLILKSVNCVGGEVLARSESQAVDKSHVLDALSNAASEMRTRLGESLSTVQKYNTPLEKATTPSLEALQAYSLGFKSWNENDADAALTFFQRATQLDGNFAMAYWAAGWTYATAVGNTTMAAKNLQKAFELRAGVSEREKLMIEGDYCTAVTGNLEEARRTYVLGAKTYPREDIFHRRLGIISNVFGELDMALTEHLESLRLAPYRTLQHRSVILSYLALNRIDDAVAAAKEAHVAGLDSNIAPLLYGIGFYRNDTAEMESQAAGAKGRRGEEDLLLALKADTAAYFGHLRQAREFSRQAASSAEFAENEETAEVYYAVFALREALFGNAAKAREAVTATKASAAYDGAYGFALALAYAGEIDRAQALADDLTKRFPEDTTIRFNYQPTLRAKIALSRANPDEALSVLREAVRYELGLPSVTFYNWPNMYSAYVRGEAYLAAHQGREAAAEFQKILDHRGIVLNEPIGALAHLQLGRAYALQGDLEKARVAYKDFLVLWKDADPDIPVFKQAKAEYAKLN